MSHESPINQTEVDEPLLKSETDAARKRMPRTARNQGWEGTLLQISYGIDSYAMEFLGTFFLVLIIGLNFEENYGNPIAVGYGLTALVFLGGHISGAHYNPAVTLGEWLCGRVRISLKKALYYVLAQLLGGFAGALVVWGLEGTPWKGPEPNGGHSQGDAFVGEFLWTGLLVLVVLNCATVKIREGNSFFGLAIGFTVAAGAYCIGPISGGGFNPAVANSGILLSAIAEGTTLKYLWIYWLAPFLGSLGAAAVFRLTNPREYETHASYTEIAM